MGLIYLLFDEYSDTTMFALTSVHETSHQFILPVHAVIDAVTSQAVRESLQKIP